MRDPWKWFHFAVCALALVVYLWAVRGQEQVGVVPEASLAGLRPPFLVNGQSAGSMAELRFLVQGVPPGSVVRIVAADGERALPVEPMFSRLHHLITRFVALGFLAFCTLAFAAQAGRQPGRVLFWGMLAYGLAVATGGIYCPPEPRWPAALRPILRMLSLGMLPMCFLHLTTIFPRPRADLERRRWLWPLLYGTALALALWRSAALARYLELPGRVAWEARRLPDLLGEVFLIGGIAWGCWLLLQSGRRAELARERQQTYWIWWGITVGACPFAFFYVLPRLLDLPELLPLHVVRLFAITVPLSFALAVARHQFLDIDLIIRRSLIYGGLAALLAVGYWFLVLLVSRPLESAYPALRSVVPVLAAAAAGALFAPTRVLVGRWVDRTFFKIRYDTEQALAAFRADTARAASLEELAEHAQGVLERVLRPQRVVVALTAHRAFAASGLPEDEARELLAGVANWPARRTPLLVAPGASSQPERETEGFPAGLKAAGLRVAHELVADGRVLGVLAAGEKESERRYIEPELELVLGVAGATAAAAERLGLIGEVTEEAVTRRRLAELDRLKSDFLSRIAHDVRTPLASIRWSADNLVDGVAGPLADRQAEYVRSIQASSGMLDRLVRNLLEVSRLEKEPAAVPLEPVPLEGVVAECASALLPLATRGGVHVVRERAVGLAPVAGERRLLAEIVTNLLENAIRYSPPGAEVLLVLERAGTGRQRLRVRDHGPGLPAGGEEALFGRFQQGPASPYSSQHGFGLGLHVVRSYVSQLGGRVTARNHPDGGAEFACEFPEWGHAPTEAG